MTDGIIVAGLVLFSLAYCISCTRWADRMDRKARAVQRWAEDQRAAEGAGPYEEAGGGADYKPKHSAVPPTKKYPPCPPRPGIAEERRRGE